MSWKYVEIGSLCSQVYSGGTPSSKNESYYGGDIPWLRTQEVIFNRIKDTGVKITEDGLHNSSAKWVPPNSIVVAMYGNSAGRVAINDIPLTTNQACCNLIINPKVANYRYVFYRLKHNYEVLRGLSRGSAQNNLNASQVKTFKISCPPINTQFAIASILSKYDDLIENNLRRIHLLEQAAHLLYKEWFVNLRFPGHEHTKIVDGVPEGWSKKTIDNICDIIGGGTPSTKKSEYWGGDITWVTPSDITKNNCLVLIDSERKITESGLKSSSAHMVPPETILMTSRASVGFFGLIDKEACTNQGFINITPYKDFLRMYLLYNLMWRVEESVHLLEVRPIKR
ncbi:restriction endonuclease subunit S [Methanohalophilus profundi]|uniref:restriction endonuclease subunit S n=1 Tax=Methanohalophilus profundi TaxID=2138083 RepID=UPI001CDCB222|nr:restriction endonuclease subunit S [Methanohalophilus profundi]